MECIMERSSFTFWMGALRVKEFTRRSCVSPISCFGSIRGARIDTNSGGSLLKTDRGSSAELLGCCVCSVCCQKCKGSNLLRSWHRSRRNTEWRVTVRESWRCERGCSSRIHAQACGATSTAPATCVLLWEWSVSKMEVIHEKKNHKSREKQKSFHFSFSSTSFVEFFSKPSLKIKPLPPRIRLIIN